MILDWVIITVAVLLAVSLAISFFALYMKYRASQKLCDLLLLSVDKVIVYNQELMVALAAERAKGKE